MKVKISSIKVGSRLRTDYGDMEGLADSIKKHGLLHPIVIDPAYNLVAGGRRLLACERAGFTEIEASFLGSLTERELRILELEENIQRKDLTEIEKSRNLVELAEIKEQELKEIQEKKTVELEEWSNNSKLQEKCTESVHLNNPNKIGVRSVSKEIGISPMTLHDAKQHVKAVNEFPELEPLPKHKAIETAKEVRSALPEEQGKILNLALHKKVKEQEEQEKDENYFKYMDDCGKVTNKFISFLFSLEKLDAGQDKLNMWGELLAADSVDEYLEFIERGMLKLLKLQKYLKGGVKNNEPNKQKSQRSNLSNY